MSEQHQKSPRCAWRRWKMAVMGVAHYIIFCDQRGRWWW